MNFTLCPIKPWLTAEQKELYDWLVEHITERQHSPSIQQMMRAMNLSSPAPIQSLLGHLRDKDYIDWQEGRARTIRLLDLPKSDATQRIEALTEKCLRQEREIERLKSLLQIAELQAVCVKE